MEKPCVKTQHDGPNKKNTPTRNIKITFLEFDCCCFCWGCWMKAPNKLCHYAVLLAIHTFVQSPSGFNVPTPGFTRRLKNLPRTLYSFCKTGIYIYRTFQADRGDKSIATCHRTKLQCLYVCLTMAQKSRSCHASWVMLGLICLFGVQSCWPTLIYIYVKRERDMQYIVREQCISRSL